MREILVFVSGSPARYVLDCYVKIFVSFFLSPTNTSFFRISLVQEDLHAFKGQED
uniref:Uncharacterized protein n=1 Tax=Anguilla anguilla TaxID=7936 RepID=A0A0E9W4L0_ANGAN